MCRYIFPQRKLAGRMHSHKKERRSDSRAESFFALFVLVLSWEPVRIACDMQFFIGNQIKNQILRNQYAVCRILMYNGR